MLSILRYDLTGGNNGYNSLLGLVKVRQTFCIFNLISQPENPSGFSATKS